MDNIDDVTTDGSVAPEPGEAKTSRRHLLAIGAAALGGAVAVDVLSASPADAATGGNMVIGASNTVTAAADVTQLTGAFQVTDAGQTGAARVSVLGQSTSAGTAGHFGVQGITDSGFATNPPANGAGVYGVHQQAGPGVRAASNGGAQLYLEPSAATAVPAFSAAGSFMVLADGSLHYSYAAGQWVQLNNGIVPLPAPIRVIDTSTGAGGITGPLAAGAAVHTSNNLTGGSIPAAATGVVANFAISGVGGALLNGYGVATIYPAGAATPATANINSGASCFAISNAVTVAFGTALLSGKVSIVWGGGGPVPNCHAYLDVIGYIL